jgi:ATP-dependent DNA ligase
MIKFPGCQLAHEWKGWPVNGPSYYHVEPKLDGFRLLALCDVDGITYHCRGEDTPGWAEHLEHITTALNRLRNDSESEQFIMFDGEIMAASWNETSKLLRRKRSAMSADLKERIVSEVRFSVFDMVYLDQLEYVAPLRKAAKARQRFDNQGIPCFLRFETTLTRSNLWIYQKPF